MARGRGVMLFFALSISASTAYAGDPGIAPEPSRALLARGKLTYLMKCLACHGATGDGRGPAGQALAPKPRDFRREGFKAGKEPQKIFETITHGIDGTPMVGWGQISERDRWGLTHYVLRLAAQAPAAEANRP